MERNKRATADRDPLGITERRVGEPEPSSPKGQLALAPASPLDPAHF